MDTAMETCNFTALDAGKPIDCSHCTLTKNHTGVCKAFCRQLLCTASSFPAMVLLALLGLYLLLAVLTYELQRRKKQVPPVNRLYIVSIFFCFAMSGNVLIFAKTNQLNCKVLNITGTTFYAISILQVYTVIWLRQRRFYTDPLLRTGYTATCQILNVAVIAGIYVFLVANLVASALSYSTISTSCGCTIMWDEDNRFTQYLLLIISFSVVLDILLQLMLLVMTLYPLINPSTFSLCCTLPECQGANAIKTDVRCMMKRLALCVGVCSTASLLFSVLLFFAIKDMICFSWISVLQFHLIVINITLVYSFSDGSYRLFPVKWYWNCSKDGESTSALD